MRGDVSMLVDAVFTMGRMRFAGKHVLITGGSTGIGLALAKGFYKEGACLTLVARTASKLKIAVAEIQQAKSDLDGKSGKKQTVQFRTADTTIPGEILQAIAIAEDAQGPVDVLVCNAGAASPGFFHAQDIDVFEYAMRLNYLGTVAAIKALYPRMVARDSGQIVIISSTMGQMGFVGYASYAPTKYALKGLADVLRNELQGTGVCVSIAYPPDTDTPGYQHENESKPQETKDISAISSVFSAEQVASWIVSGVAKKQYTLHGPDIGLNLHTHMMEGLIPRGFFSLLIATLLGLFTPAIQAIHGWLFDRIARKAAQSRFASLRTR